MLGRLGDASFVSGETRTGLIGEHIACAAILLLPGIKGCAMAQQDKVDLCAWDELGFITIQVKSGRLRQEYDGRQPTYHFNYGSGLKKKKPVRGDYDIMATVAIEKRRVLFTALPELTAVSKRINPRRFDDPDVEINSWQHAIRVMRGET